MVFFVIIFSLNDGWKITINTKGDDFPQAKEIEEKLNYLESENGKVFLPYMFLV